MNVLESIQRIEDEKIAASISVCESIMDLIDKNELINEYSTSDEFIDVIMESMLWFMESKNRERNKTPRNEISQWMEKKGYWYTGDNSKKKKECNRMYHFLQQHKFDPKTETYESDIKLTDGTNKRIKINIDRDLTKEERAELKTLKKQYETDEDNMSLDDLERFIELDGTNKFNAVVKQGKNACYNPETDDITVSSKILKSRQALSQSELKHEEGHAYSWYRGSTADERKGINQDLPKDHPANKALRDHKKQGKYVNSHDDSSEELMADAYAAEHGRKRTKKYGSQRETRQFTKSEIKKYLTDMYGSTKDFAEMVKHMNKSASERIKQIENSLKKFNNPDLGKAIAVLKNDNGDSANKRFMKALMSDGYGLSSDVIYKNGDNAITSEFDCTSFDKYFKKVMELKSRINKYKEFITKIKNNDEDFNLRDYGEQYEYMCRYGSRTLPDRVKELEEKLTDYREIAMKIPKREREALSLFKLCKNDLANNDMNKLKQRVASFMGPYRAIVSEGLSISQKLVKFTEKSLRETIEVRAKFAQSVVKEYFAELFGDLVIMEGEYIQ